MRNARRGIFWAVTLALLVAPTAPRAAATQEQEGWIDVLSVQMDAQGLMIIVCRGVGELKVADGTRQAGGTIEATFRGSRLISVTQGRESFDSFVVADDGAVMINIGIGELRPLPSGEYRLGQSGTDERGDDPQVTNFRVRDGHVVSAHVDYF